LAVGIAALEGLVTEVPPRRADVRGAPFGGVYSGLRVLITGHTGFKGSWLAYWLTELGADVAGYALAPPTEPSLFAALRLGERITHAEADVRDLDALSAALASFQPVIVFQLAAQPLVRYSYCEPRLTYETNVMGCVNLFEAVRATPSVAVVVNVTSDKCYENREVDRPYREDDALGGYDPYSSSKGCAELVTSAYARSFFGVDARARLASARAGNVIGGGDWAPDRIIPDCVQALVAGAPVLIRSPHAMRPWQHVLESLSGYLRLASCMYTGGHDFDGAWNFGPAAEAGVPVSQVAIAFVDAWGAGEWRRKPEGVDTEPHEATLLTLDSSKAAQRLGWASTWRVDEAVRRTAAWYKGFYSVGSDEQRAAAAVAMTSGDISAYTDAAHAAGAVWAQ
jgi:CDP-glucose 4,6-dehydratase